MFNDKKYKLSKKMEITNKSAHESQGIKFTKINIQTEFDKNLI